MAKITTLEIYDKYYNPKSTVPNTPKLPLITFGGIVALDPTTVCEREFYLTSLLGEMFLSWKAPAVPELLDGEVELRILLSECLKGRYLQWLVAHYNELPLDFDNFEFFNEDSDNQNCIVGYRRIFNALEWFDDNKRYLTDNDISAISVADLLALHERYGGVDLSAKSEEVKAERLGARLLYIDDDWMVVVPLSFEASCHYGQFTKWCTTSRNFPHYFTDYAKKAPLFIVSNRHSSKKYQFFFYPKEFDFRNEVDNSIYPWDEPIPEVVKDYFRKTYQLKGLTTDQLNALLASGLPPEQVFDRVDPLSCGYRLVKNDMRYNFYNPVTNQLVGRRWFFYAEGFENGKAKAWIQRFSYNYLNTDMTYQHPDWIEDYDEDAWKHPGYYDATELPKDFSPY